MSLLTVLLTALPIVALAIVTVGWDIRQQTRWQPERIAYMQRVQERDRRRPFDQAWQEWQTDDAGLVVLVDATVAGFQRRVDELAARSARSWAEFVAADGSPSLEVVR